MALPTTLVNDTTTVGKSGKAAVWSAAAVIVVALLTALTSPTVAPAFVALHWGVIVLVANVALVAIKNVLDSGTPNF